MIKTDVLQGKMREKRFTISSLSKAIGLSTTGLFNKIHNKREFLVSEVLELSRLLNLTTQETNEIFFTK